MEITVDEALQRGVAAHKEGKLEEAEKLYRGILGVQPNHPDANHNLGVLAVGTGQVEAALPHFKSALEASPNQGQYWLSYIDALIKLDRLDDARQLLTQGINAGLKGELVDNLSAQLKVIESAPSSSINGALPQQKRVEALISLYTEGKLEEGVTVGTALSKEFPDNPIIPNILGAIYSALGNSEKAIVYFKQSIRLKPDNFSVYNNLAVILRDIGKYKKSISNCKKSIALKPDNAAAYNNLGTSLSDLGELSNNKEAISCYHKAIRLNPKNALFYNNIGNFFNITGDYDQAIIHYNKAIELEPNLVKAHDNLGDVYNKIGRYEDAVSIFKRSIEIDPVSHQSHLALSVVLQNLGRYCDAIGVLQVNLEPNRSYMH